VIRVLDATFASRFRSSAIIFAEEEAQKPLAVRLLAIHLADHPGLPVQLSRLSSEDLYKRLKEFEGRSKQADSIGLAWAPRSIRLYDFVHEAGRRIPTVFLIRPDEVRFWTRAEALQEGDEIARDLLSWTELVTQPPTEVLSP
jgi:hypothetical protein